MKSKLFIMAIGMLMVAGIASAQATRTWVSGVGDDLNPCSRTAPCKTFAGAISKTAAGGMINCLDPGAYGTVTITKSITIDCSGTFAGVLATAVNGMTISGAGVNVVLRSIAIDGTGSTLGLNGVNIANAGKVTVSNLNIQNFSQAGIKCNLAAAPSANVSVLNTEISSAFHGIDLVNNCSAEVQHSYIDQNTSAGVFTEAATTRANIADSYLNANNFGVSAGTNSTIFLYGSQISHNAQSVNSFSGGLVKSHGNNAILNNTNNIIPTDVFTQ